MIPFYGGMNMLFTEQEKKIIKLITCFYRNNGKWLKYNELVLYIGTSKKTLRSYIDRLHDLFFDLCEFDYTGSMVRVKFDSNFGLVTMQRIFLDKSLIVRILKRTFFCDYKSKLDLAIDLNTSESSIFRAIQTLNNGLPDFYDLTFSYSKLQFEGSESEIQKFYVNLFIETNPDPLYWPFEDFMREEEANAFARHITNYVQNSIYPDQFEYIKVVLAVASIRLKKSHKISISPTDDDLYQKIEELAKKPEISAFLERFFPEFRANKTFTAYQIVSYFLNEEFFFFFYDLDYRLKNFMKAKANYEFYLKKISFLQKKYNLEIPDPLDFYKDLATFFRFKISNVDAEDFFLDHSEYSLNYLKFFNIDFHNDLKIFLTEYMCRFYPKAPHKVQDLIYTVYTLWPNLIPQLIKAQSVTKALIVSRYDQYYARTLADLINTMSPNYIHADVYGNFQIDFEEIKNSDYEVIITDFVVKKDFGDKLIFSFEQLPLLSKIRDFFYKIHYMKINKVFQAHPDELKKFANFLGYKND